MLLESCCGPKQIHAELAATNRQLKIWRDEVRPEACKKNNSEQDHMIICTFNYAQSSRVFFASVCIKLRRKTLWDYLRDGVRARQESAVDTQGQSVKSRLRGHLTPK